MSVNHEYSSWYNREAISVSVWGRRNSVRASVDQHAWPNRTTILQSVWSMAMIALRFECEWFMYLFNYSWYKISKP